MKKTIIICLLGISLGCNAQTNSAIFPLNLADGYGAVGMNMVSVTGTVKNLGSADITKLSYRIEDLSGSSAEKNVTLSSPIKQDEEDNVDFKIAVGNTVGTSDKSVVITKVNGKTNEAAESEATANCHFYVRSARMARKTLEEEFTGTWCGWCPRGTVGMQLLEEKYPTEYVGIAYHYKDGLYINENGSHDGFPSCIINRSLTLDPYYGSSGDSPFGIEADFLAQQKQLPEAGITVVTEWTDANKSALEVSTTTSWVWDSSDTYSLAFFLTEDDMSAGSQSNYYGGKSDYANDPYLKKFYNGGSSVAMNYDHVCVMSYSKDNGVAGSIKSPVAIGDEQIFDYELTLPSPGIIQDKDKLNVIVVLLNTTTGKVVNVEKVKAGGASTGIETVNNEQSTKNNYDIFNVAGQKLNKNAKGLLIVNGKKVIR